MSPPLPFRRRFRRDVGGAAAVEFAILAPLLILFYVGMAEMTQAMMAQRRLVHTTSLIGDMAAQNGEITSAKVDDIYAIAQTVMKPYSASPLRLCLLSVTSDSKGKDTVAWAAPRNAPIDCPVKGATVDIPVGVLPANASIIVSRASYDYTPSLKLISGLYTFKRTFYLRPRKTDTVVWK